MSDVLTKIYTIPISMVYSSRANDLKDTYGNPQLLPMIMVQNPDGSINPAGFNKIKEVVAHRIKPFAPTASLETDIFESAEVLEKLCLFSGGHVRELLLMMKAAVNRTEQFPISGRSMQRAISETRDTYRRTVERDQWIALARVAQGHQIENDETHRSLLFRRCVLEYRYFDDEGDMQCWYDVHPLIKGIPDFKTAVVQFQS